MDTQFCLEIYEPDSADDATAAFYSDRPFILPSIGHIMNPRFYGQASFDKTQQVLRVIGVEHIIPHYAATTPPLLF